MLARTVLSQWNEGCPAPWRLALVTIGWCSQPASATPRKHASPSVTTNAPGAMMRLASDLMRLLLKRAMRRTLRRAGRFAVRGLKRHDDRPLAGAAAARLAAGALATEISIIHLDAPIERGAVVVEAHDLGKLGLDLPACGLRRSEAAAELDRGDALLGLRDQVHGAEPHCQRQLRGVEDRASHRGRLTPAGVALEVAARANDTAGP